MGKLYSDNRAIVESLRFLGKRKMMLICIAFFGLFGMMNPLIFSGINFSNLMLQVSIYGIVAMGELFVVLTGEMDISVGSIMAMVTLISVNIINKTGSIILGLAAGLIFGLFAGTVSGILVEKLKVDSFIATLAGMSFYRGAAYLIFGTASKLCDHPVFHDIAYEKTLGLRNVTYIFIVLVIIVQYVVRKTLFGRNICATGGNADTAKYAGINTSFYRIAAFALSGLFASFAGFLLASRMNAGSATLAEDAGLQAISAIVVGGCNMNGGYGDALMAFSGMILIGIITNAMVMLGVSVYLQNMAMGLLLILIVSADRIYQNRIK